MYKCHECQFSFCLHVRTWLLRRYCTMADSQEMEKFYLMLRLRHGELLMLLRSVNEISMCTQKALKRTVQKKILIRSSRCVRLPHWPVRELSRLTAALIGINFIHYTAWDTPLERRSFAGITTVGCCIFPDLHVSFHIRNTNFLWVLLSMQASIDKVIMFV